MKHIAIVMILLGTAIAGLVIYFYAGIGTKIALAPEPSAPKATTVAGSDGQITDCVAENLVAGASFEGAAGTVHGTMSIKNNTSSTCILRGDNLPQLVYANSVKNVTVKTSVDRKGTAYTMDPEQTLFAQVTLQNGPQCSSEVKSIPVQYTYKLSSGKVLKFKDNAGKDSFSMNTCQKDSEQTQATISSFTIDSVD